MFLILLLAASCWFLTLHWSRYRIGQSRTVCTFRHKFILLGPRPRGTERDVSTSCRCTHFLILIPCTTKINHSFYELCAFCGQSKVHLLEHAIQLGKKQSGILWLTPLFLLRFTLVIALKINGLCFIEMIYQQSSSGTIAEI